MNRSIVIGCCIGLVALGAGLYAYTHPPKIADSTSKGSTEVSVVNYDVLNENLADRVRKILNTSGSAVQVFVTTTESSIGALYRTGGPWIPKNDSACQFKSPPSYSMPNAFAEYQLSKAIAADIGLDSSLLQKLANYNVKITSESSFSFSIVDPKLQVVSDDDFKEGLQAANCAHAIGSEGEDLYVVRGYVSGKRSFSTTVDATQLLNAGVKKIGSFEISGDGGKQSLEMTDAGPREFLQIVQLVHAASGNNASSPSASGAAPAPPVPQGTGLSIIYVQQNSGDAKEVGIAARDMLAKTGLPVERGIESLKKTPDRSEVKYFQDSDQAGAERVAEILEGKFGKVDAVRAKAPNVKPGQLEVWLAKQP